MTPKQRYMQALNKETKEPKKHSPHIAEKYLQAVKESNKGSKERVTNKISDKIANYNKLGSKEKLENKPIESKKIVNLEKKEQLEKLNPDVVEEKLTFKEKLSRYASNSEVKIDKEKYADMYNLKSRKNSSDENLKSTKKQAKPSEVVVERAIVHTQIKHEEKVKDLSKALEETLTPHKLMNVKYAEQNPEILQEIKRMGLEDEEKSKSEEESLEDEKTYKELSNDDLNNEKKDEDKEQ